MEATMGFLDRIFGSDEDERRTPPIPPNGQGPGPYDAPGGRAENQPPRSEDEIAIERYRYLLRTAPPETIEQVHAEAFARLSETQRQQVLADISAGLPAAEQPRTSDPNAMARAATRAEYMNPGFMERTLGPQRQGPSFGSMVGSSILGTVVGYVIGSALVSSFLAPAMADDQGAQDGAAESGGEGGADAGTESGGAADASGDVGWGGDAGADMGGFGDFGF
jgi:hypothetical protein